MKVQRVVLGPLDTNCFLVSDSSGGPLLVVDPADDGARILEAIGERTVSAVILTHCHFDHLAGADAVLAGAGGALMVHKADAPFITDPGGTGAALFGLSDTSPPATRELVDGDVVVAGRLELEVIHTPGHTPGGICLYGAGHLFAGDTVFSGSVGRTDFPRGDARALRESIFSRIAPLPDVTVVHPGHGPDTTIGRERAVNPFFPRA